ncbi:hypothetical protein SeMB42_g06177 [Synchytrium endobioticum]|uniref:Uncharacterized protein n=1 Tax=Synchytrium endobioticum TaxID=286115 RepID=A0A507CMM9_9FUNG|nr:hypothetical protein SeMB42_g06177 [Synchytrium endobioticum]
MFVKTVFGLLAVSAVVIAAPAVKEEMEASKYVDVHKTYKSDDHYGAEKYDYGNYGAETYGYDNYAAQGYGYGNYEGKDVGHEQVYAKEIVCPASYKILYTPVPVKCDCKTETRYEKPAEIDFKNVQYEKVYKGYENKGY